MNRTDVLLGRNSLFLNHQGFGNEKQIKARVYLSSNLLCTLVSEFDGSGYVFRNIEKVLPNSNIQLPAFVNNTQFCKNAVQELKIEFAQNDKSQIETYQVLLGGGTSKKKQSISYLSSSPNRFLTNQPVQKKTSLKSFEWLYFLNNYNTSTSSLTVKIVATLSNGTTNTRFCFTVLKATEGLFAIDVSPILVNKRFQTALEGEVSISNNSIESYTVEVGNFNDNTFVSLSEVRKYYIVPDTANSTHFCFKNSFGVFDNLRVVGSTKKSQEIEYENFENETGVYTSDTEFYDKISLQLGEFEQNWLTYLKELTNSKTIYIRALGQYQRLICTTKSLPYFDSSKIADETTIEFRYSENEKNYNG